MDNFPLFFLQNDLCVPECPKSKPIFIRVVHAAPNTPAVNIFANGELIIKNLAYRELSSFIKIPAGTYNIKVFPAKGPEIALISKDIAVMPGNKFTIAAVGESFNIRLLVIPEFKASPPLGKANVRFAHLSPNAPAVDITLPNGVPLFENVSFKHVTPFISVPPDVFTLQVRAAGTDVVVLTVRCPEFEEGVKYTLYAIGLLDVDPGLHVLSSSNQNSCYDENYFSTC